MIIVNWIFVSILTTSNADAILFLYRISNVCPTKWCFNCVNTFINNAHKCNINAETNTMKWSTGEIYKWSIKAKRNELKWMVINWIDESKSGTFSSIFCSKRCLMYLGNFCLASIHKKKRKKVFHFCSYHFNCMFSPCLCTPNRPKNFLNSIIVNTRTTLSVVQHDGQCLINIKVCNKKKNDTSKK